VVRRKALVVDDEIFNAVTLKRMLETHFNFDVSLAYRGDEALKVIFETPSNRCEFDIIFMDINMPGKSGVEVDQFIH
jgi:CheY-like chemotaxis protein